MLPPASLEVAPAPLSDDRSEITALYTSLPEAIEEFHKRRSDPGLCALVERYHQSLPPTFVPLEAVGFLFRSIITPNHEFDLFRSLLCTTNLRPLLVEYQQDVYVSYNRDKYRLCRQAFTLSETELRGLRAIDLHSLEGLAPRPLSAIQTKSGLTLAEYHHALLRLEHPGCEKHIVDFSSWFAEARRGEFYYLRYLALFICHGILFENFIVDDKSEFRFVQEKVVPSFKKTVELFGVRPLIVSLLPPESERSDHWRSLPASLYPHALDLLRSKS